MVAAQKADGVAIDYTYDLRQECFKVFEIIREEQSLDNGYIFVNDVNFLLKCNDIPCDYSIKLDKDSFIQGCKIIEVVKSTMWCRGSDINEDNPEW